MGTAVEVLIGLTLLNNFWKFTIKCLLFYVAPLLRLYLSTTTHAFLHFIVNEYKASD